METDQRGISLHDEDDEPTAYTSSQWNQVVSVINSLRAILQREVTQIKALQTEVPNFRGSKENFNEFYHLLLNHLSSRRVGRSDGGEGGGRPYVLG